ncbi:MAG TPA: hypothetical protein DDZ53_05070 [Firmicutes bacterium]|nr:hypothetical protein [Bacillota bacterium]
MYILMTFDSTHYALAAETILLEAKLSPDIQPTPRELSASCGLAIAIPLAEREQAKQLLQQNSISYRAIYRVSWADESRRERSYEEE